MWLRRQDELNEARPTERFSTAIRLLSGRAGMERRYAKDLRARSTEEGEPGAGDTDAVTDSVDVRAFAMPPIRPQARATVQEQSPGRTEPEREPTREPVREAAPSREAARDSARDAARGPGREDAGGSAHESRAGAGAAAQRAQAARR